MTKQYARLADVTYTNKYLFYIIFSWLILSVLLGFGAMPLIAIHLIYLLNRGYIFYSFIGFIFIIILSDSRHPILSFAKDFKSIFIILFLVVLAKGKTGSFNFKTYIRWYNYFLPFVLFALFCIAFSPTPITAFQKTLSYLLIIVIVPTVCYALYNYYKTKFLRTLVLSGIVVFIAGFILFFINPDLVMYNYGDRSSGALGNPNALGIFSFLFYILFFIINHYFPTLFSKRENIFFHVVIFASLIWSGSRGQTLSLVIFLITQFLSKSNKTVGLVLSGAIGIMLLTINIDVVAIAKALGFADYLRVETLDAGGGRVVAREFAWEQIQKNFWIGRGFSYTEWVYGQHYWELSMLGHEGNAHNAFLTIWLDTGLIGLMLFLGAWGMLFYKAHKNSYLALPIALAVIASNMVESWLVASLNPYTIQLLMMLTILILIIKPSKTEGVTKSLQHTILQ